jgi:hypothetical protein
LLISSLPSSIGIYIDCWGGIALEQLPLNHVQQQSAQLTRCNNHWHFVISCGSTAKDEENMLAPRTANHLHMYVQIWMACPEFAGNIRATQPSTNDRHITAIYILFRRLTTHREESKAYRRD